MEKKEYEKHHSLIKVFNEWKIESYQGASPDSARILILGRDANWDKEIENHAIFPYIEEYLKDGVKFWKTYNVHHPFHIHKFLQDTKYQYNGGGKKYHTNFAKLNIKPENADKISFVELLSFPTIGNASKNKSKFKNFLLSNENKSHLIKLDSLLSDKSKTISVAWGLINDLKLINENYPELFVQFKKIDKTNLNISTLNIVDNLLIHRHFSDSISNVTIDKLSKAIEEKL